MSVIARRWLINLALLVLLVLLLLGVQLDQRQTLRETRLTALEPDAVTSIVLERAGEPAVRLERRPSGWEMAAPFAVPVAQDAVAALLPVARAQVGRTLPAAGLDLAALGLEAPAVRLELDGLELRFGTTEPLDALRYVQQGDTVHLVDDRYLPRLLTPTVDLISRRLLPPDFSPGLGDLDGTPLTAGTLAPLADAVAVRVETAPSPEDDFVRGQVLNLGSADGGDGLVFAVNEGGTRWTRLDTGLTWLFATPPLPVFESTRSGAGITGTSMTPPHPLPVPDAPGAFAMPPSSPQPAMDDPFAPLPPAPPPQAPAPEAADRVDPVASTPASSSQLPVQRLAPPPPGSQPREQRPTDAIPNLRDMVPARNRDPNALRQLDTDPFAPSGNVYRPPPDGISSAPPITAPESDMDTPLRTEKLRP